MGISSEVSVKFSSYVFKSARAGPRVAGISPGLVSGPSLSRMNEGLQCQNCQNALRLSEVQTNLSDVQQSKQDLTVKAQATKVEKTIEVTENGPAVGLDLHLFLIFAMAGTFACGFDNLCRTRSSKFDIDSACRQLNSSNIFELSAHGYVTVVLR